MCKDEIIDNLDLMVESMHLVQERFSMRLKVIGESVKQIQKTNPSFLKRYAEVEWDKIARFRDLVSHHCEYVDHENTSAPNQPNQPDRP